jgi:ATP-dependent Clp protease ATP-binding subunit ClpA
VALEVQPEATAWLAEHGYDRLMGARPLARLIQEKIKKPLADLLLFGPLKEGGALTVGVEHGKVDLKVKAAGKARAKA